MKSKSEKKLKRLGIDLQNVWVLSMWPSGTFERIAFKFTFKSSWAFFNLSNNERSINGSLCLFAAKMIGNILPNSEIDQAVRAHFSHVRHIILHIDRLNYSIKISAQQFRFFTLSLCTMSDACSLIKSNGNDVYVYFRIDFYPIVIFYRKINAFNYALCINNNKIENCGANRANQPNNNKQS